MVAGSGHLSIPARRLGERLRDLREHEYRQLTQKQLAKVLGGTGPLSIATVSLWEKPGSDRLPPPQRLAAYARLFCSSRSFAASSPRLLRDDELTETEQAREAELYAELLALRERAQSTGTNATTRVPAPAGHRSSIWGFPDAAAISIVCSDAPDPPSYASQSHLNYSQYARFADLDALLEIFGQVKADNPQSWIRIMPPASLTGDFALNHLVIIGGAAVDDAAPGFSQSVPLPVPQPVPLPTDEQQEETHVLRYETEGLEFKSSRDDEGTLTYDIGFLARAPHKIVSGRTVTVIGGITSRGVHGAALGFIDTHVRDSNEQYLRAAFGDSDTFCIVMRIQVRNGMALPPNLWDDDVRQYEWCPETGARW